MELSTLYRECTLNQVSENDIGKERRVAGWVENIRDHGGVSFVDLRDMYGVLQIVMRDTSLLKGINKEDCISVLGKIEKRDEETYNPKIPTGTIELEAHSIEILGKVYRPLPFEIATSKEIREDLRLKYRFLDLRNPKVMSNMIFRSNVIAFLRQKMTGYRPRFCVHLLRRAQETISFRPDITRVSSTHFHRHPSSISSF